MSVESTDVTTENKEIVEKIFDQMAAGNVSALSAAMADDCRWILPGNWSWSHNWGPKETVLNGLLRPLMAQFNNQYRFEADLILADGDRVVVQARGYGLTKGNEPYHQTYCLIFQLRDGQLVEVVEHCDTALVERVLEPIAPT